MDVRPPVPRDSVGDRGDVIERRATVAAAEQTFDITPNALAMAMASRVTRERKRIAIRLRECLAMLNQHNDTFALDGAIEHLANELDPPAVEVRSGDLSYSYVEDVADTLPPVRHMDDFDQGLAMVRNARGPLNAKANE